MKKKLIIAFAVFWIIIPVLSVVLASLTKGYLFGMIGIIYIMIIFPLGLSVFNFENVFINNVLAERFSSTMTLFVGMVLYALCFLFSFEPRGEWYIQIYDTEYHNILSTEYLLSMEIIFALGVVGFMVLLYSNAKKNPPLVSVFAIASVIILNIAQILFAIHLSKNIKEGVLSYYLYVYHANIFLISAIAVRRHVRQQLQKFREDDINYGKHRFFARLYRIMSKFIGYSAIVFMAMFLIIAILEILFVIVGQGIDAPIKAFTNTADWTFSKQIPPEPMIYDGHYLCTVAAGGHRKIVKPLRYGTRLNETIIVNRQLCIANAFEEKIHDMFPRFHKVIRKIYDDYGFPISKLITTPLRADMVYVLMKPLEWIFLFFLYFTDTDPEKRIKRQYSYKGMT